MFLPYSNTLSQALIDEGADLLVSDGQGNNVFTILAKNGHLWTINYVYQLIWLVFVHVCFCAVSRRLELSPPTWRCYDLPLGNC